jgi:sec-independent protein translocase protein TatA
MINTMFGLLNLGGGEIILILALVLILFGARKLPELAKGLGQGIKEFKKATREVTDEVQRSMDDNHYSPPPTPQVPKQIEEPVPAEKVAAAPQTTEKKG